MFVFILLNTLAFCSSYRLAGKYNSTENASSRLLTLAVVFYSQIILIPLFWGILGKLSLENLILSALIIFSIIFLIIKPKKNNPPVFIIPKEIIANKIIVFCVSVLLGFALVKIAINLVNPPFGWDSLNYHFSFPVEWMKHKNLANPITINDDLGPSYYPINGSLIYLWGMYPLKNAFMADLGQIPFFVISFIAVYGICRKFNISREYSFYAAGLFTITPNYFKQMEIAYVDVMVAGWFLSGCYFLLSFYREKRLKDVALFSLSLGFLIGTKTIALPYAAVLILVLSLVLFKRRRMLSIRRVSFYFLLVVGLIIISGGYGYIRNFIQTGNPLYPLNVEFLGKTVFKGIFDKSVYTAHVDRSAYALNKILFSEGLGGGLIVFVIPAFFVFVFNALKKRINVEKFSVFLLPIILCFIWRFCIPLANLRYLYPALALGFIVPFMLLSEKKPLITMVRVLVILCFLASSAEIATRLELVSSLALSAVLFFGFNPIYNFLGSLKIKGWLIAFMILAVSLSLLNIDYRENEYRRYISMVKYSGFWPEAVKAWDWLNANTIGDNIAYVGRPVPFPLYGTDFKNNVYYASVNKTDPAMAHYFPNSRYRWGTDFMELHQNLEAEGNYREHPDYALWLANLKKRKTDYLFIYSLHQTKETAFPTEDIWARMHPEEFTLSFSNSTIHIYKVTLPSKISYDMSFPQSLGGNPRLTQEPACLPVGRDARRSLSSRRRGRA
ncbi:MAG: phospholipid carrier-dependent glycosyltransferase [Candidatus Omnitrophota bacterium]|nr:phospholipid carrier-dependent glycosyltransferase [Candidatus Omnitrophota bacterium]